MNLNHFFGLIIYGVFQNWSTRKNWPSGQPCKNVEEAYQSTPFFCPIIWAKDGFNVSLQINRSNYCRSSKGYRTFSFTWEEIEWGYPENTNSESEFLLACSSGQEVGSISTKVMEQILSIHGGIDWDKTLSEAEKYIHLAK